MLPQPIGPKYACLVFIRPHPLSRWMTVWAIGPYVLRKVSIHFRLLARDEAGNIGSAQTAQPVLIDLKRPKARMIGVQAVSQGIGY